MLKICQWYNKILSSFLATCLCHLEWEQISSNDQISSSFPGSKLFDSCASTVSLVRLSPQHFCLHYATYIFIISLSPLPNLKLVGKNSIRAKRDWKTQLSLVMEDFCLIVTLHVSCTYLNDLLLLFCLFYFLWTSVPFQFFFPSLSPLQASPIMIGLLLFL